MADPPLGKLTRRRLFGLDRSGEPPAQTRSGEPLRPWTIPNAIGYLRAAMLPVFLVAAFTGGARTGIDTLALVACLVSGVGDYLDGMVARLTGQYSRLGTLLDPVIDRAVVISGVVVCWHFQLLPRWALALLLARELSMLIVGRLWVARGLELRINWPGRIAVGPTMLGLLFGLIGVRALGEGLLYAGLALALLASVLYVRAGISQLRAREASESG